MKMNFKSKAFLLAALLPSLSFAQKVDLDKFFIQRSYRELPTSVVDTTYKTYSIEAPTTAEISYATIPLPSGQDIDISGLKKLNSGGHYVVKLTFIDARIDGNGNVEKKESEKKDGAVVREWMTYKPYIDYTCTFKSELYDYKGRKISNVYTHTVAKKRHFPTDTYYNNSGDASNYYYNNYKSIFKRLISDEYATHIAETQTALNSSIGFRVVTNNTYTWMNNSKKHPEYDKQQSVIGEMKVWAAEISGSSALTEDQVKKANEFLEYFESLKKKYTSEEKADKKLRYSAYYNKAIIYLFYLDQPMKAYEEGNGLIANDYDTRDGKDFQSDADKIKMSMDKSKKKTRHFEINTSEFKGPNE